MIIKNLFFPPKCVFCQGVLPITHKIPNICKTCSDKIVKLPVKTCNICGKPKDVGYDKPYCMYCAGKLPDSTSVISLFPYEPQVRSSVLRFKFGNKPYYAKTYAYYIYERLKAYGKDTSFDAIVPTPISLKRLFKRGYNQSYLLAKALSKYTNTPVIKALKKIKDTPPQSTLSKEKRLSNLKGSIAISKKASVPPKVLLLDDVYTTGTTASTCAKILRKNGAKQVMVSTIAMHLPTDNTPVKTEDNLPD